MLTDADAARLHEMCALERAIMAVLPPEHGHLMRELDELSAADMLAAENRILRIVGAALIEHDLGDVFEDVFRQARDTSRIEPGDARRFLFRTGGHTL